MGFVDENAVREFLSTTYPRLVGAVALIAGSRPAGEDAVQEALARAWERSVRGQEVSSLGAWVTTVSINLARSGLRRVRAERSARQRLGPMASAPSPDGDRIDVTRALATLPRRQREVTVLRYYLGMDVAEIASTLGVSSGSVKTLLHRARRSLSVSLGDADLSEEHQHAG